MRRKAAAARPSCSVRRASSWVSRAHTSAPRYPRRRPARITRDRALRLPRTRVFPGNSCVPVHGAERDQTFYIDSVVLRDKSWTYTMKFFSFFIHFSPVL